MTTKFITPVDVTPGTVGSWQDIDVSSYVSAAATGVMIRATTVGTGRIHWRKNGSTDALEYFSDTYEQIWFCCGIDGSDIFEMYIKTLSEVFLIGYTEEEATYFTNITDIQTGSASTWNDYDISGDTGGDTAIAAILNFRGGGHSVYGVRKNGSTDNIAREKYGHIGMIIGVDSSEILEGYQVTTADPCYLTGYFTKGITMFTNQTVADLYNNHTYSLPLPSIPFVRGMIIEAEASFSQAGFMLRKPQSNLSWYANMDQHAFAFVECDSTGTIEGRIQSASVDFGIIGYWGKKHRVDPTEVALQVTDGDRDGYEDNWATWVPTGRDSDGYQIGYDGGVTQDIGLSWTNVTVPKGAKIISAKLEMFAKYTSNSGNLDIRIACIAEDNVAVFSSSNRPSLMFITGYYAVNFDDGIDFTDETWVHIHDIKLSVQQVIDRPGWESGNALGVMIYDWASGSGDFCQFQDYDRNTSQAAKLTIEYMVVGGITHIIRNQYNFKAMPSLLAR